MQLAIGPVALLILNTSIQSGYANGLLLTAGSLVADAAYMFLACIGVSQLLQKKQLQFAMKITGALVLMAFGINTVISIFDISIFPKMHIRETGNANLFFQGIILQASNPLTILFFSGIFTSMIMEKNYTQKDAFKFAFGCILARICFLLFLVAAGNVFHAFLSTRLLKILNVFIGIIIIYFGVKLLVKKGN